MAILRYAQQEAANIRRAEARAIQQARLTASLAVRRTEQTATQTAPATWVTAPSGATDPGAAGQIAYDSGFLYVCTATDTWVRAELATW